MNCFRFIIDFGPNCEFSFKDGIETGFIIERLIDLLIEARTTTEHEVIPSACYILHGETCSLNSNTKECLEWRDICDNELDCINGEDERRCWELDMNSCNLEIEFRCRNGLCISREFLFDGDFDCMDGSDERLSFPDDLCYEAMQFDCEEHICPSNLVSCLDGQCIDPTKFINRQARCISRHRPDGYLVKNLIVFDKCAQYPLHFYRCIFSNECISNYWLFDGYSDCLDRSDENLTSFKSVVDKSFLPDRYECETVPGMIMLRFLGKIFLLF